MRSAVHSVFLDLTEFPSHLIVFNICHAFLYRIWLQSRKSTKSFKDSIDSKWWNGFRQWGFRETDGGNERHNSVEISRHQDSTGKRSGRYDACDYIPKRISREIVAFNYSVISFERSDFKETIYSIIINIFEPQCSRKLCNKTVYVEIIVHKLTDDKKITFNVC